MMAELLRLLSHGEIGSLLVLIVLLYFVGRKMVEDKPGLHTWGLRLAAVAFLAFSTYRVVEERARDAEHLLEIVFRGLLAGGLFLGVAWITLPVLAFAWDLLLTPWQGWQRWRDSASLRAAERQARERQARWRREDRELAEQAPQQKAQVAEARRRRTEARACCEELYLLHSPEIQQRFSRAEFERYLHQFLGDEHPPEAVEERARQLQELIRQHASKVGGSSKDLSISDRVAELEKQIEEIEKTNLPRRTKDNLISALRKQFAVRLQRELEAE